MEKTFEKIPRKRWKNFSLTSEKFLFNLEYLEKFWRDLKILLENHEYTKKICKVFEEI